uniref:Membrane transporter protein n=1 Tax=Aplanochytrium stocchinoi TaxID=215587 RepID=A0A7S3PN27_9STRA|mmetsp:Transcript_11752/g.13612  ORF Transcript_11752/g.13612 Transcript_11752/m.13612 type:complete len:377 (+) Transcript_11752:314-1444(+)|eukprot:CAMPEP_0204824990 /NCGR_PEP_ID=MMETSP1346-20131115/2966_1 /ASSEMBLY_ACC=CAM_ASM_000771 /TAXON_ID=215587 /ORGANISM="Aplanochytrium stocchinoi, Strain GSBS06" /LENGTH=376 /DNA_ID=CAMNT_0051952451 /DNA_START=327 /DNA_END=1457 /DNA_ORIENTATION=-
MSNETELEYEVVFDEGMYILLPPLFLFHGVAAATLSTSSFLTIFPVLAAGFDVDVLTALSISILVDSINGIILSIRYRHHFPQDRKKVEIILVFSVVGAITASLFAYYLGIDIIAEYSTFWKNGAGYTDFVFAIGFFIRGYNIKRKNKAAFANEVSANELSSSNPDVEAADNESDEPSRVLKQKIFLKPTSGGANSSNESLEINDAPAPVKLSTINATPSTRSTRSFFKKKEDKIDNEPEPLPPLCSKRWVFPVVSFLVISGLSGMIGFGSGNIVAIIWIISFKWDIVPSTAVGSLFSALVMGGVFGMFFAKDVLVYVSMKKILSFSLPLDMIAVVLASRYAQLINEEYLSFIIAFLFLAIGIGVTTVSLAFSGEL